MRKPMTKDLMSNVYKLLVSHPSKKFTSTTVAQELGLEIKQASNALGYLARTKAAGIVVRKVPGSKSNEYKYEIRGDKDSLPGRDLATLLGEIRNLAYSLADMTDELERRYNEEVIASSNKIQVIKQILDSK